MAAISPSSTNLLRGPQMASEEERGAHLEGACQGDPDLRARIDPCCSPTTTWASP